LGGEVVELRVHGVGGESADNLMGEAGTSSLTRVAGRGPDAFFARLKAPHAEGYAWGPLTSGKAVLLLWVFLLPLVLVNVAGWMVPDVEEARGKNRRAWGLARLLVAALGFTLTVTYVLGSFAIIVKRVFYQSGLRGLVDELEPALIWWGFAAMLLLWVAVFVTARSRQIVFEEVSEKRIATISKVGIYRTLTTRDGFDDLGFWNHLTASRRMLRAHAVVAAAALGWTTYNAWTLARNGGSDLGLQALFVWLGLVQAALLAALLLTCATGFKNVLKNFVTGRFRVFGAVVASTVAVGISAGYFSLLVEISQRLLGESGSPEGPEVNLNLAFGVGALAFISALGVLLVFYFLPRAFKRLNPPLPADSRPDPGEELRGLTSRFSKWKVGFARSISDLGRNVDLPLSAAAAAFALAATPILLIMTFGGPNNAPAPIAAIIEGATGQIPTTSEEDPIDIYREKEPIPGASVEGLANAGWWSATFAAIGSWLGLTVTTRILQNVRKAPKSLVTRRNIGKIWDVLTVFPRRFHPLSVRPYAERAVPELQGRILHHIGRQRGVILSTHSQGTVVGFAALAQIIRKDIETKKERRPIGKRISFLTYGSPLTQLHSHFFPAYFNEKAFADLRDGLFDDGGLPPANWRNFYRLTDYIGKEVRFPGSDRHNETVDDPAREVRTSDLRRDADWDGWPDPMRTPWVGMEWHSNYNREKAIKDWVDEMRKRMSSKILRRPGTSETARVSAQRLAEALVERLGAVQPYPMSIEAVGGCVVVVGKYATARASYCLDSLIEEDGDSRANLAGACERVLSSFQDYVSEDLTEPWPARSDIDPLARPFADVKDHEVLLGYRLPASPDFMLPAIPLIDITADG
jgi:hypothetical protein